MAKTLRCGENQCLYHKEGACGFRWIEPPEVPPRGSMSRDYCPQYAEVAGDEIRLSMSAYN